MKRLSTGVLTVLLAAGLGLNAVAAPTPASHGNIGTNAIAQSDSTMAAPPANFGSPPSGQVPILFNDHHVYTKPDTLKQGRVLAALVRGGTVLIPLRSMFEQMGATVSYDAGSKTVDVSKPGADVKVTVGKPEVIINGESRPLDVPPMMYQGHIVVPVRVISEGMGAYVEWVPDKQVVVVRYVVPAPPTPTPTEAPTTAPAPVTPPPTPTPTAAPYNDLYVVGDYLVSPVVYNEFSAGNKGDNGNSGNGFSFDLRGAAEFTLFNMPWMVEGDYRQVNYPHTCGTGVGVSAPSADCFVTTIGGGGQTQVAAFQVRDYDFDGRIGLKVFNPRVYIGFGYLFRTNNAGYPKMSNIGFGLEKLPDLDQVFSVYGSAYYYSNVKGNYTDPAGNGFQLSYNVLKYQLGVTFSFKGSPIFIDAGVLGESDRNKLNAPSNASTFAPYAGLGLKF